MKTFQFLVLVVNIGLILSTNDDCQRWDSVRNMYQVCFMKARGNFTTPVFSGNTVTRWYISEYAREECRTIWPSVTSCMNTKLTTLSCSNKADIMNVIAQHQILCDNGNLAGWVNQVLQRLSDFPVSCLPSTEASRACMGHILSWQPPTDITLGMAVTEIQRKRALC